MCSSDHTGYGLDPGYFQFEITENVATEYSESSAQPLMILQKWGSTCAWMISVPVMQI